MRPVQVRFAWRFQLCAHSVAVADIDEAIGSGVLELARARRLQEVRALVFLA